MMRPIDIFDFFVALGRVEAGITLSRATGSSDEELEKSLQSVIDFLPPFMDTWLATMEKGVNAEPSVWPPENVDEWHSIIKKNEHIALSGEAEIEALWRISGALGYTLWVPMPAELEGLLAKQFREIGLNEKLIMDLLRKLSSNVDKERIYAVEILRELFRQESTDQADKNQHRISDSIPQLLNEVLMLQPNFFGVGINLNAIVKRWLQTHMH